MQVRHPGVPPTHAEAARFAPPALTRREDEVLRLIALGNCNKEIAATVGISPRTVKFHITNLLLKFGVSSRLEANDPPFINTTPDWTDELGYHDCNGLCHPPVMNWTTSPQCNVGSMEIDFADQEIRFGAPSGSPGSGERVMHDAHTRWQNCGDHVDPLSPVD